MANIQTRLHYKTFEGQVNRFYNELWYYHIIVPLDISSYYKEQKVSRLICVINEQVSIPCALMPSGNNTYFINLNKEVRASLSIVKGSPVKCELFEDTSTYGMPMPEEMKEALALDPLGDQYFHKLTPGKQRSLLYLVGKPKGQDKRIEKAIIILNHLVANNGVLNFKLLNEAFKSPNL